MPRGRAPQCQTTVRGVCSGAALAYWSCDDKPARPLVTSSAIPTIATATLTQATGCAQGDSAVSFMPKRSTLARPRNCGTTMAATPAAIKTQPITAVTKAALNGGAGAKFAAAGQTVAN